VVQVTTKAVFNYDTEINTLAGKSIFLEARRIPPPYPTFLAFLLQVSGKDRDTIKFSELNNIYLPRTT
jgi:hypothetical protein